MGFIIDLLLIKNHHRGPFDFLSRDDKNTSIKYKEERIGEKNKHQVTARMINCVYQITFLDSYFL